MEDLPTKEELLKTKIDELKKKQEHLRDSFVKCAGGIEILEVMLKEKDEVKEKK